MLTTCAVAVAPTVKRISPTRISLPAPGVTVSEQTCVPPVASSATVPWNTHVRPWGHILSQLVIRAHPSPQRDDRRARVVVDAEQELVPRLPERDAPGPVEPVRALVVRRIAGDV